MTNPLSAFGRFFSRVFHAMNHGSHTHRQDQVSEHLKGRMSDANSEAKAGPPGTGAGGGLF